jgi:hypothetical protein
LAKNMSPGWIVSRYLAMVARTAWPQTPKWWVIAPPAAMRSPFASSSVQE